MDNINIVGDTHNFDSLKIVLSKFNNIISLGDIAAVDKKEYFNNITKYSRAWREVSKNKITNKLDAQWFSKLSIEGWKKQINQINNSGKNFTLCLGNSDLRMLEFFKECQKQKKNFAIIKKPTLKKFNKIRIIILPYKDNRYKIKKIIKNLKKEYPLFVIAHCPAFKNHHKKYYENHYQAIKQIKESYGKSFTYIHGHVHPKESYKYYLEGIKVLAPKANESLNGIGIENHIIMINTNTGEIKLIDSISLKTKKFKKLPKKYLKSDHWNDFIKPET